MTIYGATGWPYMELQDDHVWGTLQTCANETRAVLLQMSGCQGVL